MTSATRPRTSAVLVNGQPHYVSPGAVAQEPTAMSTLSIADHIARLEQDLAAERAELEAGRFPLPDGERICRTNIRLIERALGAARREPAAHAAGLCICIRPDDPCNR